MKGPIMKKFFFIAVKSFASFLLTSILAFSWAQEKFPSRQVTFVIPQAAGGANDAIARVVAQKLSELWGQSVIVENRPALAEM